MPVTDPAIALPLSRDERQRIQAMLLAQGEDGALLAGRLAADWELDPATRVLLLQLDTMTEEVRTLRWWVLGVVVLAMLIQAGMVGLSISLDGGNVGSVQVAPTFLKAQPAAEAEPVAPWVDTAPGEAPPHPRPTL